MKAASTLDGEYYITCKRFTVSVKVRKGEIIEAAPIVRKFIGQNLNNLRRWARSFGEYDEYYLKRCVKKT